MKFDFVPIADGHKKAIAAFDCGKLQLNDYLKRYAGQNHRRGTSRCTLMVTQTPPQDLVGYFTLSSGEVERDALPPAMTRHLARYPVPVVVIGRLAIDSKWQRKGLGARLLMNALRRVHRAHIELDIGIKAVIVDAKDESSASFYASYDFITLSEQDTWPRRMALAIETLIDAST